MTTSLSSLDEIGLRVGTDKSSRWHGYLDFYERFLEEMRFESIRVLEVGIFNGESLRMWEEYFPNASITAFDIDPRCLEFASSRTKVVIGDQSNIVHLLDLATKHGPFDLVLDDGSHMWEHQITTLRCLYPFVKPGRFYILEDIDTSYGGYVEQFKGVANISAADYLKKLCDYVVADEQLAVSLEEDAFIRSCAPLTEFIVFKKRTSLIKRHAQ